MEGLRDYLEKKDQRNERSSGKKAIRKENKGEKASMEERGKKQWRESNIVVKEKDHFLYHQLVSMR